MSMMNMLLGAGAFNPLTLNPALWLDASVASSLFQDTGGATPATADTNPVGRWNDLSGNGRNVTQATAGNRPILKTAIQNGRNVVRADGVDDVLTNATYGFASNPYTLFIVTIPRLAKAFPSLISEANGTTLNHLSVGYDNSTPMKLSVSKTGTSTSASNLTQAVGVCDTLCFQSTGIVTGNISVNVRKNGVDALSSLSLTGLLTNSSIRVFSEGSVAGGYYNGDICELILVPSTLSNVSVRLVEIYLKSKWGTP
jgi:hypothetical protein